MTSETALKKIAKLIYQASNLADDLDGSGLDDLVGTLDGVVDRLRQVVEDHQAPAGCEPAQMELVVSPQVMAALRTALGEEP